MYSSCGDVVVGSLWLPTTIKYGNLFEVGNTF